MLNDPAGTNDITRNIIGGSVAVHQAFGPGLVEGVYDESLIFELRARGLKVEVQIGVPLVYRGRELSHRYVLDLRVEGKVIVEVKSVITLAPIHTAQLITYLKLTGSPVGLLINFNVPLLKDGIKRVVHPDLLRGAAKEKPKGSEISTTEQRSNEDERRPIR